MDVVEEPPISVLVVDDQAPFRRAAATVVALTKGFEMVGEARSGEEAVTMVDELSNWPMSSKFDERQRAVLSWAEQWVTDPEQITDEDATRLRASLSDRECAALSTALAVFESLTRTRVALGLASSRAS